MVVENNARNYTTCRLDTKFGDEHEVDDSIYRNVVAILGPLTTAHCLQALLDIFFDNLEIVHFSRGPNI